MTPTLAVSIINYRTAELTLNCIRSVLADLGNNAAEVVVVDNASGDGSEAVIADWIAQHHLSDQPVSVRLIQSGNNSGFSGGHNQAIAATTADWVVVLNSDSLIRRGMFAALRQVLASAAAEVGLVAPRLEGLDGTVQTSAFRFPGPVSELIRGASSGPVTRLLKHREVALGPEPDPTQVDWISFACVALRRRMIDAIGPMDEGYFLYFEDAEYGLRARRAGWRIELAPAARVVHLRGGSGPVKARAAAGKRLPSYFYRSRARFFRQAHGPLGPLAGNLAWHLGRTIAQTRRLTGRGVPRAVEAEARDIWTNALNPLTRNPAPGK